MTGADVVAGYSAYIRLVAPLIAGKETIRTGMTQEVDRVAAAIDMACGGKAVALVSSGDPGIYAMAGLALEMCETRKLAAIPAAKRPADPMAAKGALIVEIVPGIPALCAGAALLGAPLMHDFAAVSLSDLLTPWELIEKRLHAAASADFVIVIYNPKSKKRDWQLDRAREICLMYRDGQTPVGIVTGAMRKDQDLLITTLEGLNTATVNMQTTVFIGNQSSRRYGEFLYTPRGYANKYEI